MGLEKLFNIFLFYGSKLYFLWPCLRFALLKNIKNDNNNQRRDYPQVINSSTFPRLTKS